MKNWNETLKCALDNVDIVNKNTVALHLPDGQCADMTGAIKIATMLNPGVKLIKTYSGEEADIAYYRRRTRWQAIRLPGTRRVDE